MLEKTLGSPLDSKETKPVNPKGNQSWIVTGRALSEAETLILWPCDGKSWHIGKDPGVGKDWRQKEKRMTDDEIVGLNHCLNGNESEQTPGNSEGQASLAGCSSWGHKLLDTTQGLNNNRNSNRICHHPSIKMWRFRHKRVNMWYLNFENSG